MTDEDFLKQFGKTIRAIREESGLSQEDFADKCSLHRTYIGGIERGERNISVINLNQIIESLGLGWSDFARKLKNSSAASEVRDIAAPVRAFDHIRFFDKINGEQFELIEKFLTDNINDPSKKARDAIAQAFIKAVSIWPDENISDIWHHCIYRIYRERKKGSDPEQSWVRTSGEAFELFIESIYNPYLHEFGLRIRNLISRDEKKDVLDRLKLGAEIGSSKIDLIIEQQGKGLGINMSGWGIVGAIHAKVSLAERVSDDIPASRILMRSGIQSILLTLDVKSFPPPGGDLINRGELGTPDRPSDKRKYIEEHGDFSVCVSYNSRTVPSNNPTTSGKKILTVRNIFPRDPFIEYLVKSFANASS